MVPICDGDMPDVPVVPGDICPPVVEPDEAPGGICPPVVEPDPEVWARTKGAAANTRAIANTVTALSFLDMCVFSSSIRCKHK